MKPTLILLSVLLLGGAANAATYYVDSVAGDDLRPGDSPGNAWRSLARANAAMLAPGDTLALRAGGVWRGVLHPRGSGTARAPIALDRYGDGPPPRIEGGGVAGGAVCLTNQQHWRLRHLEVTNTGSPEPRKQGIAIRNEGAGVLEDIEVIACEVHDVDGDLRDYRDGKESCGIVFIITVGDGTRPSSWRRIRIVGNHVHDVGREGILLQSLWVNKPADPHSYWAGLGPYTVSTDIRVAANRLEYIAGDGIIPWCVADSVIEHNVVAHANHNSLGQGHAALWPYFCQDVVMQFNEVWGTETLHDGMAFDFDNSDQRCIYQYNYSHDNQGGFLNMCCDGNGNGNVARYNLSRNDGCVAGSRVFLVHGAGNHGYQIYNNTVVAGFGDPAMFEQGADSRASTIDFVNNILVNTGRGSWRLPGGCRFDHNLCWGGTPDLGDPHALLTDPLLVAPGDGVDGLRLAAGSPAFGAGLVVEANGGRDYWGRPVRAKEPVNVGADNRQPPR